MATTTIPRRTRTNARPDRTAEPKPAGLDVPSQTDPSRVTEPCGQTIRLRDGVIYFVVQCAERMGHVRTVKHRAIVSADKGDRSGRSVAEITWSDA